MVIFVLVLGVSLVIADASNAQSLYKARPVSLADDFDFAAAVAFSGAAADRHIFARQEIVCPNTRKTCGLGSSAICAPLGASCCSTTSADYCYSGETCREEAGKYSCGGRPDPPNCGILYKACGNKCIPNSFDCCTYRAGTICFTDETCATGEDSCCSNSNCGTGCLYPGDICCGGVSCSGTCNSGVCSKVRTAVGIQGSTAPNPSSNPSSTPNTSENNVPVGIIAGVCSAVVVLCAVVGLYFFIQNRKKKQARSSVPLSSESECYQETTSSPTTSPSEPSVQFVVSSDREKFQLSRQQPVPVYYNAANVPRDLNEQPIFPFDPQIGQFISYGAPILSPPQSATSQSSGANTNVLLSQPPSYTPSHHSQSPSIASNTANEPSAIAKRMQSGSTHPSRLSYIPPANEGDKKPNASVIRSYVPKEDDEIEIRAGDPIFVNVTFEDGWVDGINLRLGTNGFFPLECLQINPGTSIRHIA